MTTTELMDVLRKRGVVLQASGDRINYRARPGALTPELRANLVAHKRAILAYLRKVQSLGQPVGTNRAGFADLPANLVEWPEEWQEAFDERAAIMQFEGKLDLVQAERRAEEVVREMFRRTWGWQP